MSDVYNIGDQYGGSRILRIAHCQIVATPSIRIECSQGYGPQHLTSPVCTLQTAVKAVKAKVEPKEVVRYEEYDKRHGAKYAVAGAADMEEDDDGWDM